MVHLISSDAHQSEWRNPEITAYKEEILEIIGKEKFEKLTMTNPSLIIEDQFISSEYDKVKFNKKKEKKSIFNFWRRK